MFFSHVSCKYLKENNPTRQSVSKVENIHLIIFKNTLIRILCSFQKKKVSTRKKFEKSQKSIYKSRAKPLSVN